MKYIGIDYGKKRIGVAISDEKGEFAFPETVLLNEQTTAGMPSEKILNLCQSHNVTTVVVGESRDFKGNENRIMEDVKLFVTELQSKGLEVIYEPEIMSTIQAERLQGVTTTIDASAAAVILQSYLDRQKFKNTPQTIQPDKYTIVQDDSVETERTMEDLDVDDHLIDQ